MVFKLVKDLQIQEGFWNILKPLQKQGRVFHKIGFRDSETGKEANSVTKDEAAWFKPQPQEEELEETKTKRYSVYIETAQFHRTKSKMWAFRDKESGDEFKAHLGDEEFRAQISNGDLRVCSEDVLQVEVEEKQSLSEGKVKTERTVTKVIGRIKASKPEAKQLDLDV